MTVRRSRLAALCSMAVLSLHACATSRARFPTQRYLPVSSAMHAWGKLELDDKHLRLEALTGEMKLRYAGRMPEMEGSDLSSASVYRVKNAANYFKQNIAARRLCAQPVRWVAVGSRNGAPAWSGEIWLTLLTIDDWTRYAAEGARSCASGTYVQVSADNASRDSGEHER